MKKVRSTEDSSVVDSEEGFRVAPLGSFPNALAGATIVHLFHTFFDWCFEKANHCPCTKLREGDVRCVSGDPLVGNEVGSHAVACVITLANSIRITVILGRPARPYTTKYCA